MDNTCSCHCERAPQKRTVFLSKDKEVYRIPALFYNKDKNIFLAFAEQRDTTDDASAKHLVMKTGTLKEESPGVKTIEWSEFKLVKEAHLDGHRPMNPCPVYDKTTKTLFLFFICVEGNVTDWDQIKNYMKETNKTSNANKTCLCYVTSTDDGQTWSTLPNSTDSPDLTDNPELAEIKNSATFSVGPGHGIQMESGRLIVPTYAYNERDGTKTKSHAFSLYSDDSGETWHLGTMLQKQSIECQMAEFFDDEGTSFVYCNARIAVDEADDTTHYRVEAVSENKGDDFKELTSAKKLVETGDGCQGSVVSFPAEGKDTNPNKWLLFTHPSDRSKRVDLGVYLNKSPQDPNAWSKPWILNSGPSGYSDLVYIGDGWFACLVECGKKKETEQIASVVFHYDDSEPDKESIRFLIILMLALSFFMIVILSVVFHFR